LFGVLRCTEVKHGLDKKRTLRRLQAIEIRTIMTKVSWTERKANKNVYCRWLRQKEKIFKLLEVDRRDG